MSDKPMGPHAAGLDDDGYRKVDDVMKAIKALKLTLEPTSEIATVDGSPARVWRGVTADGTEVKAWIRCVQAQTHDPEKLKAFDVALLSLPEPKRELVSFDMRFVL